MHFDLRDLMFSDLRSDLIAVDLISEMGLYGRNLLGLWGATPGTHACTVKYCSPATAGQQHKCDQQQQ